MSRPAAVAAVGVNSVATFVTHLALIAAVWSLVPTALTARSSSGGLGGVVHRVLPGSSLLAEGATAITLCFLAPAVAIGPNRRRSATRWLRTAIDRGSAHVRREVRDSGRVLLHPGRAAMLWLGSAASPVVHALILVAVYNALSGGLSSLVVALVYLVASSVAALVPSPGGFGALDVTLVGGLVAVGTPTTTALAAVLGYRLITVWLPLIPGILVFAALLRRRVL
jgi:uncharacterized membrane protein YbhN (UPF0104 family)